MKPLRKCRNCGLEAYTEEDLKKFKKNEKTKLGRRNFCLKCWNKRRRDRYANIDWVCLKQLHTNMMQRCYNPKNPAFKNYSARDITVCQEWHIFKVFYKYALTHGWKRGLFIDRIKNDESYSPENCHFVTRHVQNMNTRRTVTNLIERTRVCTMCREKKSEGSFYNDSSDRLLGKAYNCVDCRKKALEKKKTFKNLMMPLQISLP